MQRCGVGRAWLIFRPVRSPDVLATVRRLIPGVYLPAFLMFFGVGMLLPTLPLFAAELGVNYTLVTLAVAVTGLGTLLWNVPAGLLQARWSEQRAAIVGVLVVAAATLALGFTRDYALVVVFRALAGIGTATWTISRMAHLVASVPQHHRGRAMSLFGGIMRISIFPSPAVGGWLAESVSFEASFLVAGPDHLHRRAATAADAARRRAAHGQHSGHAARRRRASWPCCGRTAAISRPPAPATCSDRPCARGAR